MVLFKKKSPLFLVENISEEFKKRDDNDNFFLVSINENNNIVGFSSYGINLLVSKKKDIFDGVNEKQELFYKDPIDEDYQLLAEAIFGACEFYTIDSFFITTDGKPVVGIDCFIMKYCDYKQMVLDRLVELTRDKLEDVTTLRKGALLLVKSANLEKDSEEEIVVNICKVI